MLRVRRVLNTKRLFTDGLKYFVFLSFCLFAFTPSVVVKFCKNPAPLAAHACTSMHIMCSMIVVVLTWYQLYTAAPTLHLPAKAAIASCDSRQGRRAIAILRHCHCHCCASLGLPNITEVLADTSPWQAQLRSHHGTTARVWGWPYSPCQL